MTKIRLKTVFQEPQVVIIKGGVGHMVDLDTVLLVLTYTTSKIVKNMFIAGE